MQYTPHEWAVVVTSRLTGEQMDELGRLDAPALTEMVTHLRDLAARRRTRVARITRRPGASQT